MRLIYAIATVTGTIAWGDLLTIAAIATAMKIAGKRVRIVIKNAPPKKAHHTYTPKKEEP